MRFAHARPAAVTLVAGGGLITATSVFSLAAALGTTAPRADLSGYAVAMDDAAAGTSAMACEPLKVSTPTPTPTTTPTPPPTHTATPTPPPTPTPPETPTPT